MEPKYAVPIGGIESFTYGIIVTSCVMTQAIDFLRS